ncbi:unnamed protein product [Heterobilharzia americana]|nr:unnamed protein product [Heterobilharzia americana]
MRLTANSERKTFFPDANSSVTENPTNDQTVVRPLIPRREEITLLPGESLLQCTPAAGRLKPTTVKEKTNTSESQTTSETNPLLSSHDTKPDHKNQSCHQFCNNIIGNKDTYNCISNNTSMNHKGISSLTSVNCSNNDSDHYHGDGDEKCSFPNTTNKNINNVSKLNTSYPTCYTTTATTTSTTINSEGCNDEFSVLINTKTSHHLPNYLQQTDFKKLCSPFDERNADENFLPSDNSLTHLEELLTLRNNYEITPLVYPQYLGTNMK